MKPRTKPAQQTWAYAGLKRLAWNEGRTPYLKHKYSADEWATVQLRRKINDISARIRNGRSWLTITPTSSPKHAQYVAVINDLVAQREALRSQLK